MLAGGGRAEKPALCVCRPWVLSQKEALGEEGMEAAAIILAAMELYRQRVGGWKAAGVSLLAKIKERLENGEASDGVGRAASFHHVRFSLLADWTPVFCPVSAG